MSTTEKKKKGGDRSVSAAGALITFAFFLAAWQLLQMQEKL